MDATQIMEHMPVLGADDQQIGMVDKVEGDRIKLTKKDQPDGQHHYIPMSWVTQVDEHVHLSRPSDQARQEWMSEDGQGSNV